MPSHPVPGYLRSEPMVKSMRAHQGRKQREPYLMNTKGKGSNPFGKGRHQHFMSSLDAPNQLSPPWPTPVTTDLSSPWNTSDVGYFTPDDTAGDHRYIENNTTYYTNVFVNHIRSLAFYKPEPVIRANLHFCLRDKAQDWIDMELNVMEREMLRVLPLETGWIEALLKRFKPLYDVALRRYKEGQYAKEDAENRYDPVKWAHGMIRNSQAAGITSTYAQLKQIWYGIDLELQWPVNCPAKSTLVSEFMKELDDAYVEWCDGENE
ncbi:hypothetical protein N7448_000480 [Penicillium atrosanguineum]|nr:hypothetical protein N7448_000480 [Penicillium atrosanguineum]